MEGDIGKEIRDKRSRRTMIDFMAQKSRIKITTFNFVYWEAVDKMMDNHPQQFCLWVTKHVSKFRGKKCYKVGERKHMCYAPDA